MALKFIEIKDREVCGEFLYITGITGKVTYSKYSYLLICVYFFFKRQILFTSS